MLTHSRPSRTIAAVNLPRRIAAVFLSCATLAILLGADRDRRKPAEGIDTPEKWARRRAEILDGMQQVMGKLPDRVKAFMAAVGRTDRR